jgi:hypothetical protein
MSLTLSRHGLTDQVRLASSPARLRRPAFAVIDGLQRSQVTGGEMLLGTAVALVAMCESANVPLAEVLAKATRICGEVEGPFTSHLQSVRDFATNELRKYR